MKNIFTEAQIADFLRKSYITVDGLWFVKTEELKSFDDAIELDVTVWEVMAKIQARKARALLGITGNSIEDLARAFQLKLSAEEFDFDTDITPDNVKFTIRTCPWYEIMKSSNRLHISEIITNRICVMEFSGWANEFSPDIKLEMHKRLCIPQDKCKTCEIEFCRKL